jgi:restriction endonuclease S subunit
LFYSQGTTFEAINRDEIAKVALPFTSNIKEQQKIASILSKVDELIEQTDRTVTMTISPTLRMITKRHDCS